jgi:hypothetical protein
VASGAGRGHGGRRQCLGDAGAGWVAEELAHFRAGLGFRAVFSLHFFVGFFLRSSEEERAGGGWTRGKQRVVTVTVRPAPRWKWPLLADLVFRCPNVGTSWTTIIICAIGPSSLGNSRPPVFRPTTL